MEVISIFVVILFLHSSDASFFNSHKSIRDKDDHRYLKSDDYYTEPTVKPTSKSDWKTSTPTIKTRTYKPTVQPTSYPSYQGEAGGDTDISDISDNIIGDDDDGNVKQSTSSSQYRIYIVIAMMFVISFSVFGYVYYQRTKTTNYNLDTVWSKRDAASKQEVYSSISNDESDDLGR